MYDTDYDTDYYDTDYYSLNVGKIHIRFGCIEVEVDYTFARAMR